MLFNNSQFHTHKAVFLVLKNKVLDQAFVANHLKLWRALAHVIQSLKHNFGYYRSMPDQVALIRRQDLLDDETLIHLYAIKLEMKLLSTEGQRQIEDERQDLVANATWMMIALWHAVNEDRHCILNSVEETILMVSFKDMILTAILQAADDAADQDEKRKLTIIFNRLFAPRCQKILMNGLRILDPFQWRILPANQRSQGVRKSAMRSRSGSRSASEFHSRNPTKGRVVAYNQPHGFWRRRATSRSQSPGIMQNLLPNLERTRIRTPQPQRLFKGSKTERDLRDLETQEERLKNRISAFFNDWKPEKKEESGSDADSPFPPRVRTPRRD
jgi:hypothetical protein